MAIQKAAIAGRLSWLVEALKLEGELTRNLEDTRIVRSRRVAEGARVQPSRKAGQVGMIHHVEGFHAQVEGQTLDDREVAAECSIHVVVVGATEGITAKIAIGADSVLGEGRLVDIGKIARCLLRDLAVRIDSCSGNQIGTIKANAGKRIVDAGGDVERCSAGDTDDGASSQLFARADAQPCRLEKWLEATKVVLKIWRTSKPQLARSNFLLAVSS